MQLEHEKLQLMKEYCKLKQHPFTVPYKKLQNKGIVKPMQNIWVGTADSDKTMIVEAHVCLVCKKVIYVEFSKQKASV